MKFPINYEFVVPHDHRRLVYYAKSSENSVLAIETNSHRCIVLADSEADILEASKMFSESTYTAAVTTWHTLTLDWRMAWYDNNFVLIKGGTTWQAVGIAESPWKESPLACDPHTWIFTLKRHGSFHKREDAILVGNSPADLIIALDESDDFNPNDLVSGEAEIVAVPMLQIAAHNSKVFYRGKIHDVAEAIMNNTAFLMELIEKPQLDSDPENNLIEKIEEEKNEN